MTVGSISQLKSWSIADCVRLGGRAVITNKYLHANMSVLVRLGTISYLCGYINVCSLCRHGTYTCIMSRYEYHMCVIATRPSTSPLSSRSRTASHPPLS